MIYLSTAIGLTPGGSTHLHIYNTENITINNKTTQITYLEECWLCPVFANYSVAFALQLGKKHGKTSVRVAEEIQSIHIIKTPTHYKTHPYTNTHTQTHTHTHTNTTKQFKITTVQIKTNTVQDIPKWNNHNIIKFPQYKVTIMYIAPVPQGIHRNTLHFTSITHFISLHFKIKSLHNNPERRSSDLLWSRSVIKHSSISVHTSFNSSNIWHVRYFSWICSA
jgi:hypothetical protein